LKFKVDENLPTEYAPILREAGFEADTVSDEKRSGAGDSVLSERCRAEDRVWMTLDLDFANVQAYPPKSHPGIVVFRSKSQDKPTLVALLKRLVPALLQFSPKHSFGLSSRTASDIAKNNTLGATASILIRARSVVQVHPGPP
jgi:predicted nuclease of predicted toxin-antitoxin system